MNLPQIAATTVAIILGMMAVAQLIDEYKNWRSAVKWQRAQEKARKRARMR